MRRLLDYDHASRTKTWHEYDFKTGKTYIQTEQDVRPYLERNKRLANDSAYKAHGKKHDYLHIATIPNNVILQIKKDYGIDVFQKDDLPRLEKLLQTSDFKYLRTVDRI